jgi:hypothetical protein
VDGEDERGQRGEPGVAQEPPSQQEEEDRRERVQRQVDRVVRARVHAEERVVQEVGGPVERAVVRWTLVGGEEHPAQRCEIPGGGMLDHDGLVVPDEAVAEGRAVREKRRHGHPERGEPDPGASGGHPAHGRFTARAVTAEPARSAASARDRGRATRPSGTARRRARTVCAGGPSTSRAAGVRRMP